MTKQLLLVLCILVGGFTSSGQERISFSIGETIGFYSNSLSEDRALNVYLPTGYADTPEKDYPVIYLLDGSTDEDFIHISGLVQFGSFSWINMLPESIVVGIVNIDRKRDFTYPTTNKKDKLQFPTTGGSAAFIDFIEKELQPFVTKNYRVQDKKTLIGQSLGGLLATEILYKKPHLFNNYIIVSPSLWWDDESLLSTTPMKYEDEKSVYIAVGKEGAEMEHVAEELHLKLQNNSGSNSNILFRYFEELDHGDTLHLAAYDAFKKVFAPTEKK